MESVLVLSSFSPTMMMYGIFWSSALRIFLLKELPLESTETLSHLSFISAATLLA